MFTTCFRPRLPAMIAAILLPFGATDVSAATAPALANLPPPGLYRIDTDANAIQSNGAVLKQKNDSASGMASMRVQAPGGAAVVGALPSPGQLCIGATGSGLLPSADQQCTSSAPVHAAGSTTFSSRCPSADTNVAVRKLNATTWEMKTSVTERMGQQGLLDFDQQRKTFENVLKNSTSADEREDARYALENWEEHKADMRAIAAERGGAGAGGAVTRSSVLVTRLTRIGGQCRSVGASATTGGR